MATVAESRSRQPYPPVLLRQVPVRLLELLLLQQLREPALRLGRLGLRQRPQAPILRNNRHRVSSAVLTDLPSCHLYLPRYSPLVTAKANERPASTGTTGTSSPAPQSTGAAVQLLGSNLGAAGAALAAVALF